MSAPFYMTRSATVVSFQQLDTEDDAAPPAVAAAAAATTAAVATLPPSSPPSEFVGPDGALLPDAPVAHIAGTRLPRYVFSEARVAGGGLPRPASVDLREAVAAAERAAASASNGGNDAAAADAPAASATPADPQDLSAAEALGAIAHRSLLDAALLALWDERAERGLFRYDVTACPTRVLPGVWGFVAQLNEGRATLKRPTEFRVDAVVQPFDGSKFNFKKAYAREVLFAFEPRPGGDHARPLPGHPLGLAGGRAPGVPAPALEDGARMGSSPHLIVINVSPIDYGHVLLVPSVLDDLPQLLTPATLRLALQFAQEAGNPYLRVGFNSLGAYATINHLHFQAYYLAATMPYERAPTTLLPRKQQPRSSSSNGGVGGGAGAASPAGLLTPPLLSRAEALVGAPVAGVRLSRTSDYPVRGFVAEGGTLAARAAVVGAAAVELQRRNQPHNVLVSDAGGRVFLFPQRYAQRQARGEVEQELLETGVNPAAFEIAGHMVMKRREDYDAVSQDLAWRLLDAISLTEEAFLALAEDLFGGGGCPPPGVGGAGSSGEGASRGGGAEGEQQQQQQVGGLAAAAALPPRPPTSGGGGGEKNV